MTINKLPLIFPPAAAAFFLSLIALPASASGPLAIFQPGEPYRWPAGGVGIPYNPDQGALGILSGAEATALVADSFLRWEEVASATATYVNAGQLPVDVDVSNFGPFLEPTAPDGLSAIVFDENGEIFELLFGPDSGILGFAGPEWLDTVNGTILEGVSFINGGAVQSAADVTLALGVLVHEFGHYNNLAHTQVNGTLYIEQFFAIPFDSTGPDPFDLFPAEDLTGRVETMYPFLVPGDGTENLKADDIAYFSVLYPAPDYFATTGSISGTILAPNLLTELTGVNVIARNVEDPFDDAVSAISSDATDDLSSNAPFVGVYTISGLTSGAKYLVYADELLVGEFSTPPLQPLPSPEETYNGPNESNDGATDAPNEFFGVPVVAGVPTAGIDIILNRIPPGPIELGDDDSRQLFLPFEFEFCGRNYDTLFVNSNGSVTFDAASPNFAHSPREHLATTRIAPFWTDLNPTAGGMVSFDESDRSFTVRFTDVPEYPSEGANNFELRLYGSRRGGHHDANRRRDDQFVIEYGALSAVNGLAGYSCGDDLTSSFENESDVSKELSADDRGRHRGHHDSAAVYEWFIDGDNDLAFRTLAAETPDRFRDRFEPNDTVASARRVHGPFDTGSDRRRSDLDADGDVDLYRFKARAGQFLLLEVVPDSPDTMIGVFDTSGNLLALNDDAFGIGSGSQLLLQAGADVTLVVGVTTWPDFEFDGTGGLDSGRYVLSLQAVSGEPLVSGIDEGFLLGDDDFAELPLDAFEFPFQGERYGTLYVNSNGHVTMDAPDPFSFIPEVSLLLNGPPRIAAYWDDLTTFDVFTGELRGIVLAEQGRHSAKIHYLGMRNFPGGTGGGSNSFSVKLDRDGSIKYGYGPTNRAGALVGATEGNGAADPGPTDLSEAKKLRANGTVYEAFPGSVSTFGGHDLSFDELRFRKCDDCGHDDDDDD